MKTKHNNNYQQTPDDDIAHTPGKMVYFFLLALTGIIFILGVIYGLGYLVSKIIW